MTDTDPNHPAADPAPAGAADPARDEAARADAGEGEGERAGPGASESQRSPAREPIGPAREPIGPAREPAALGGRSAIDEPWVQRLLVVGGPLVLLATVLLSLWVATQRVEQSVIVQVEQRFAPGERLGIRTQLVDGALRGIPEGEVELALVPAGGEPLALPALAATGKEGVAQGTFVVPEAAAGPAALRLRFIAPGRRLVEEWVPVELGAAREPREGTPTTNGLPLAKGDDSDVQLDAIKIDVRPVGRMLSGFSNRVLVRVTEPDGAPWAGPIEVMLLGGEFREQKGSVEQPVRLVLGSTDAAGLLALEGPLTSDRVRLEVRVLARDEPGKVVHRRKVRLTSFPGAVVVHVAPGVVRARADASADVADDPGLARLRAAGLGTKRSVFVDAYDAKGGWIDTIQPAFMGGEPPRPWDHGGLAPGVVQFEGYHFTNSPGDSTAVALLHVTDRDPDRVDSLAPLVDLQRARLGDARDERSFDAEHERRYMAALLRAPLRPEEVTSARDWLLGTMPLRVLGPPTALNTRQRNEQDLHDWKATWTGLVRAVLLGGGAVYLLAMTVLLVLAQRSASRSTLEALEGLEGEDAAALRAQMRASVRTGLWRAAAVLAIMGTALVMTVVLLESLVWDA